MQAEQECYSGLWSYDSYPNGSYSNPTWSNVSWFVIPVGSVHTRVTRAYAPEALSTGGDCYGTSWAAINYTKFYSPQPDYEVATEAACSRPQQHFSIGEVTESGYFLAGDALLSIPPDLSLVDPLWSTCTAEKLGGYDPPRALTAAIALAPGPTTTPDPPTQAKPASSPINPLPAQTPTAESDASAKGQVPADGSRFDPPNPSPDQISKIKGALAPTPESNTGPNPGDQDQEGGAPAAASPQQGEGHENPLNSNPHPESDAQDEYSSQIPDPTAVGNTKADDPRVASMVVGTHTILVGTSGTSFDGAPLESEGSPVTVSGAAAMIQGSSILIGDAIVYLPSQAANNPTLIAGHTVTPLAGAVAIDGETLHAGDSPRTISGALISLDSNDNLALNPTVQALPTPPPPVPGTLVGGQTTEIDGQAFEVFSNGVSIAGTTLTPGGPAATISGTSISLDKTALILDGSTIPVSLASPTFFTTAIGGQVVTAAPSSLVMHDISIEPGAPSMTINNELVSLNKAGSLIIGSRTIALSDTSLITRIGDELITAAATGVQIAGSKLLPGAAGWTIDGTKVSLNVMGDVIIGEKTIALDGDGIGMGGLILAGLGSKGVAASTSSSLGRASGSTGVAGTGKEVIEGRAGRLEAVGFWASAAAVAVVVLA